MYEIQNRTDTDTACCLSAPLTALADDAKPTITDAQLSKMQKHLQLSDEQVANMRQIREDGGSKQDMRAVLTDEQKEQAKEMKNKRKEKGGKGGKGAKPDTGEADPISKA